jgi:isoleucyl-tRNA synthetase
LIQELHNFCTNELSAFYFDIRKDRLYCDRPDLFERRATRTVMAHVFECLTAWLSPYLCFTAEEAWEHRPQGVFEDVDSVHLRVFPDLPESWKNDVMAQKWKKLMDVRRVVLGALEPKRAEKAIGSSLEAAPIIYVADDAIKAAMTGVDLAELCITSQASVKDGFGPEGIFSLPDIPGVAVEFAMAEGKKCQRCWKTLPDVGRDHDYPDLSPRDADAVRWYMRNKKAA